MLPLWLLIAVGAVLLVAQRAWPVVRGQNALRVGFGVDVAYLLINATVGAWLVRAVQVSALLLTMRIFGGSFDPSQLVDFVSSRRSFLADVHWPVQSLLILLISDVVGYWRHRLFHGPLWSFHAIHHSCRELDWMSAARSHPVEEILKRSLQAVVLILLGFDPVLTFVWLPVLTVHGMVVHANVNWTFGPLRHIIASPAFHRTHHRLESVGQAGNFSALFPFIDLAFGTYRSPDDLTVALGVGDAVPEDLPGQLSYPFTRLLRTAVLPLPGPDVRSLAFALMVLVFWSALTRIPTAVEPPANIIVAVERAATEVGLQPDSSARRTSSRLVEVDFRTVSASTLALPLWVKRECDAVCLLPARGWRELEVHSPTSHVKALWFPTLEVSLETSPASSSPAAAPTPDSRPRLDFSMGIVW